MPSETLIKKNSNKLLSLLSILLALLIWQVLSGIIAGKLLPSPLAVFNEAYKCFL